MSSIETVKQQAAEIVQQCPVKFFANFADRFDRDHVMGLVYCEHDDIDGWEQSMFAVIRDHATQMRWEHSLNERDYRIIQIYKEEYKLAAKAEQV